MYSFINQNRRYFVSDWQEKRLLVSATPFMLKNGSCYCNLGWEPLHPKEQIIEIEGTNLHVCVDGYYYPQSWNIESQTCFGNKNGVIYFPNVIPQLGTFKFIEQFALIMLTMGFFSFTL